MALEIKKDPTRSHGLLLRGIINRLATCFPTVALLQRSHSTHQNLKVNLGSWPSIISTLCTWLFILYLISLHSFPSSLPNHNTTNSGKPKSLLLSGIKVPSLFRGRAGCSRMEEMIKVVPAMWHCNHSTNHPGKKCLSSVFFHYTEGSV